MTDRMGRRARWTTALLAAPATAALFGAGYRLGIAGPGAGRPARPRSRPLEAGLAAAADAARQRATALGHGQSAGAGRVAAAADRDPAAARHRLPHR